MKVLLLSQIAVVDYKYTFSLANALRKQGNEVELVIDDKKDNDYCKCKCYNKFLTSRKDIGKVKKLLNYCSSYRFVVKKAVEEGFDIVHVQWFQFSPIDYHYLKKLKKRGVKLVVSVHDILPFNAKFYDLAYHKKIYALCDHIIVQAKSNIKRFDDMFPEDSKKVTFVPHGHFLDFAEKIDKTVSREHLGIPHDKKVFLFFGQIKKVKGVDVLLKAFADLVEKDKDAYLIIAGSVWKADFHECEEFIAAHDFDGRLKTDIRYIPDEEVKYYYSAADVCVLPYTDVYQSGVIQLAYGYQKPVVCSNLPAFTQFVHEGETGFISEAGDPESLESAMMRALESGELEEIGKAGYELVKKTLNWDDLAKKIVNECYR